ncbi:MAG: 3-phenylpropionate-dihydrodiol/cinnamic acid-dihydrodiol dehydrogenase (plasmid) [Chroococcopsis gigantea SAG 12.99]|jgi:uncharacterized oxidoreductase|nr:3-phenylpropionate-dihydrodiol/cinnamic acid-dihydrodiol dehydrogenase [Chroococcopsis gigantea SAG 12.99]
MQITNNTILITGGTSGIGKRLAESFHALGNEVIIAGRRKELLEEIVAANPGMAAVALDVEDPASIRSLADEIGTKYPKLNVLINNAGIMRAENIQSARDYLSDAESIVTTNLLGPIRLIEALLPILREQPYSAIMNVSSGLAFVPLAITPTYCATKAAVHSYTQSLRYQLRDSNIEVLELVPPYVATDLMNGASDPLAMPLDAFISEVMNILKTQPEVKEICVERANLLRLAAQSGRYDEIFQGLNARRPEG